MFLLPRILFIVCWWARFDTLASWVDWFPIHTRPLFVMCLVTFASVLFGAIALIPLCGHSPQIQKKKKNKQFSYHISRTMGDCYTLQAESTFQWWIQGRGTGDPRPHLILRSNWFPKGGKKFFWRPPPLPLSKGLDDPPPPPPYLKVWIRYCIFVEWVKCVAVLFARQYTPRKCVRSQGRRLVHKFLDN